MVEYTYNLGEAEICGCLELSGQPAYLLRSRSVGNPNRVTTTPTQMHCAPAHKQRVSHTGRKGGILKGARKGRREEGEGRKGRRKGEREGKTEGGREGGRNSFFFATIAAFVLRSP